MKKYIPYIIVLIVGAIIGWLSGSHYFREAKQTVQRDTVTVYKTVSYSKPQLSANTFRLELPKIDNPAMVFIREDSTTIIYRDSIRYVTYPRQYFYTKVKDAEIWHSGIDSTIDSLNVFTSSTIVTETVKKKEKKNAVSIGIEASYVNDFRFPLHAEYSYRILPWLSVYGYGEYELRTRQLGVGVGTSITIEY